MAPAAANPLPVTTVQKIEQCLASLEPQSIEVTDDSASHAGHAGARDGGGHYELTIVSPRFAGKSRVERHRMVYAALGPLMQREIHALALTTYAPGEL
jgi:BolA family transcriptional regulator, general stress-responsive regulator